MKSKHLLLLLFFAAMSLKVHVGRSSLDIISGVDGGRKHYIVLQADCDQLCIDRCNGNSNHKACLRTCGTCCSRCGCVPPGRYADRNSCGSCYADMTTHNGWLKCP